MKLSEADKKLVRRLQKNERAWRWVRWFTLFGSVGLIVQCALLVLDLVNRSAESDGSQSVIAIISPVCWILLCLFSALLGYTLACWRGDPKARLLLRLLEEHENHEA